MSGERISYSKAITGGGKVISMIRSGFIEFEFSYDDIVKSTS